MSDETRTGEETPWRRGVQLGSSTMKGDRLTGDERRALRCHTTAADEVPAPEWTPLAGAMRCLDAALDVMVDALVLAAEGRSDEAVQLIATYMDNTDSLTEDDYARIGEAAQRKIGVK
jgi:hypothetical protein